MESTQVREKCFLLMLFHGFIQLCILKRANGLHNSYYQYSINHGGTNISKDMTHNSDHSVKNLSTLQLVIVVTRHGSKTPVSTYPTDPYPYTNRTLWPDGTGELTKVGKQQMYVAGKLLRNRYQEFLNEHYIPEENIIRANRLDRVFMSAACLLAGLYPPKDYQLWNPDIYWQPIPIWEDPFDFNSIEENCQILSSYNWNKIKDINLQSLKEQRWQNYFKKKMGKNAVVFTDLSLLYEVLYLQRENGYRLPDWTNIVYPDLLREIHIQHYKLAYISKTEGLRLTAGPMLKSISQLMINKTDNKNKAQTKFFIETVHDLSLVALLSTLGIDVSFIVEPSALLIFELHKSLNGYEVQFLYYNKSTKTTPNILNPPNCPAPCSLEDFLKLSSTWIPTDFTAECNSLNSESSILNPQYFLTLIIIIILSIYFV